MKFTESVDFGGVGISPRTSIGATTAPGGGRRNGGRGKHEGADAGILFLAHMKPILVADSVPEGGAL